MAKLFGVDIAKIANQALGKGLLPLTVTVYTPGTRTPGSLTAGTQPTSSTATGRGIIDDYDTRLIDGTRVQAGDRKVLILGDSIAPVVPKPDDQVTIEGATYRIVRVARDPAAATYTCQVRS